MDQTVLKKFKIQDAQYHFPYHHLVNFPEFNNGQIMMSGIEYFGYLEVVLDIISKQTFKSLLDVGCGDGKMIFELSKTFSDKKFVGIDLSEHSILFAKAFNYSNGATFELKDIKDVTGEFDVISLIETLEHIPDDEILSILKNIDRLLKKGGRVVVSVPASTIPVQKKHYRHYTEEMLKDYFKSYHLLETNFLVRKGFLHKVFVYVTYKLSSIRFVRKLSYLLAKKLLFRASRGTGRHIVSVFKKV